MHARDTDAQNAIILLVPTNFKVYWCSTFKRTDSECIRYVSLSLCVYGCVLMCFLVLLFMCMYVVVFVNHDRGLIFGICLCLIHFLINHFLNMFMFMYMCLFMCM